MPTPGGHALGAIADRYDPRDYPLHLAPPTVLPPSVDLRPQCSPIRDQGQQGSCTGFGLAGLMEYREHVQNHAPVTLSPAFIYWQERTLEHSTGDCQAGAMIRDGLKSLQRVGICPESSDPYSDATCTQPSAAAVAQAGTFRIASYHRVPHLQGLKAALAASLPVVLGILVYPSFERAVGGTIPMPSHGESPLGGHCVLAVGYDDATERVTCRNSWGVGWGDQGYFTLPYAYINSPKLASDLWVAI